MKEEIGTFWEWFFPIVFIFCAGWTIWHAPVYILDTIPPAKESIQAQMADLMSRKDITPGVGSAFGGHSDYFDWVVLLALPVLFYFGARGVRVAEMEYQDWRPIDRIAMFIGRITMVLIACMTFVMLYEVFVRDALEKPTKWANELTLWIAGFIFLCSGLYAMQQRCHIRIFLLYDAVPRWLQKTFDCLSVLLLVMFVFFMVYGSYYQIFYNKFYKWEMFGTAFDPPIPATIQPTILIIMTLVACQAIANLIADWHKVPEVHTPSDDIDERDLEAMKRSVGSN